MTEPVLPPPATSAHLDEVSRQQAAEGSLDPASTRLVEEHLRVCDVCAADVERLRSFMSHVRTQGSQSSTDVEARIEALWPAIQARIEQQKVVTLSSVSAEASASSPAASPASSPSASRWRRWAPRLMGLAAAGIVGIIAITARVRHDGTMHRSPAGADAPALIQASDSARIYQQEARDLLDQLELQRSMLRPSAVSAIDRDLRVVDSAIAELNAAIARDPNNPALRQLLAESYRHKVDVLRRVGNAG